MFFEKPDSLGNRHWIGGSDLIWANVTFGPYYSGGLTGMSHSRNL